MKGLHHIICTANAMKRFAMKRFLLILALLCAPSAVRAANPGDACGTAGAVQREGGVTMVCDGANWLRITESDGAANLGVKQAAPKAPLHVGGEAIIGVTTGLTCDADREGGIRWNDTDKTIEMCDGATWKKIVATTGGVNLKISPPGNTSMDVAYDGVNIPTIGAEEIFTVTNTGDLTSDPLTVALTGDTTNFTITVNTCSAVTLAKNESCEVRIKPQVDGNYIFRGTLEIQTNNAPTANLEGEGSGFGCNPGVSGFGGIYATCGLSDGTNTYDLIVTPGGCDGTTNEPTCSGTDSVTKMWGNDGNFLANYLTDGPQNTVNLYEVYTSGLGSFPAAEHCMNLILGGYDDWYLPAFYEMRDHVYPNKAATGGFSSTWYVTSSAKGNNSNYSINMSDSGEGTANRDASLDRIRCARRHDVPLPAAEQDTTPDTFTFKNQLVTTGQRVDSNTVIVNGITGNVSVSLTGSNGSPAFKINGGAEVTSGTVSHGDTLTLVMTGAASADVEYTVTVTVGTYSTSWTISTGDCLAGAEGKGGIFAACGLGGGTYDLVVQPGGCDGSTSNPTCDGSTDTVTKFYGSQGVLRGSEVQYLGDGPQNSVNLMVFVNDEGPGAHPAAEYCMNMTYGGYGDWYLPASGEYETICNGLGTLGSGFVAGGYRASTEINNTIGKYTNFTSCTSPSVNKEFGAYYVRCARREGEALPAPTVFGSGDATPDAFSFTDLTNQAMNTLVASNALAITGFDGPKIVRATGAGNPELRVNGGTWGNDLNINPGDTLEVRQTTSTAPNTTRVATVTLGTVQDEWAVTTEIGEVPVGNTGLTCDGSAAGYVRYNSGTVEYCDGTSWSAIGGGLWTDLTGGRIHYGTTNANQIGVGVNDPKAPLHVAGEAIIGATSGLTCDADRKGGIRWNDTDLTFEMCDGTNWRKIVATGDGTAPAPPPGAGYLVLSSGTWNGNLKTAGGGADGIEGANKLCLQDLTTNDWLGKADAQARGMLDSTHVKAFICKADSCNNLIPATDYAFAKSGDPAVGGATFTTDATGLGPGDNQAWSASNRFGVATTYWTARDSTSSSLWKNGSTDPDGYWFACGDWGNGGSTPQGRLGNSGTTNDDRWEEARQNCATQHHLICAVHPSGAGGDITPDAFSFTSLTNQALNTLVASDAPVITGFDGPLEVNVTGPGGPQVRVNGGSWGNSLNISPGETLEVRQTTSAAPNATRTATVTLGTATVEWNVTTDAGEVPVGNTGLTCDGSAAGYVRYNSTGTVVEYCDGTSWSAIGGGLWTDLTGGRIHYGTTSANQVGVGVNDPKAPLHVAGEAIIGTTSGLACDADREGGIRWNDTDLTFEMCDGTDWKLIYAIGGGGTPSTPSPADGYFVITDGTWNGNLKTAGGGADGLDGANKLCLQDLTTNDWMGKADAQARGMLNASNVKAFICGPSSCNNALPGVEYFFAVSGAPANGGASFTTDGSGKGPGNTQSWSGTNYFSGDKTYWTNRGTTSNSLWNNSRYSNTGGWSSMYWDDSSVNGSVGHSNATDSVRWIKTTQVGGGTLNHLVCMVHPQGGGADITPDAFSFTSLTNQALNTLVVSGAPVVTGFDGPLEVNVTGPGGPQVRVNGGSWGNSLNISPGETLEVRQTTSAAPNATRTATVTLGTATVEWSVTTDAGEVPVGNTGLTCDGSAAGYVRYNSGTVEYCDGTSWSAIGGGLWTDLTGGRIHYGTTNANQIGVGVNDPKAPLHVAGEAIIGTTSGLTCDADRKGGLRWSDAETTIEMCDGTTWRKIAATAAALDCTPDAFTFTDLTDQPLSTLIVSNTVNITGIDAGCTVSVSGGGTPKISVNGGAWVTSTTIDPGDSLRVQMTSSASVSTELIATVTVGATPDNWSVTTKVGCAVGVAGAGGIYAACGASYDLVVMPGGCDGNTNEPTCDGGYDSASAQIKPWGSHGINRDGAEDVTNGPQNTVNLMVYVDNEGIGTHPAAEYCANMIYNGYNDWYLPAQNELGILGALQGSVNIGLLSGYSDHYASSTERAADEANYAYSMRYLTVNNTTVSPKDNSSSATRIRCVRREGEALPAPTVSIPTPETGYFVITAGSWDGDLKTAGGATGGMTGADNLCLTDLTNNDWMGKADAQARGLLDSAHVQAFLCDGNSCQNALPNVTYYFAVSGAPASGGASFTTNGSGSGPGNTQNWAGVNYFGTTQLYWQNRGTGTATAWDVNPAFTWQGSQYHCANFSSASSSYNSIRVGDPNRTDAGRWWGQTLSCDQLHHLVCLVNPL